MKRLLFFVLLPMMLIIGAGIGALLYGLVPGFDPLGKKQAADPAAQEKAAQKAKEAPPPYAVSAEPTIIFQPDEFVVNLQGDRRYPVFLLLSLAIELRDPGAQVRVNALEPRIRDVVNIYLSSLTPEDLKGFDGITRVRNGLWVRLREVIQPDDMVNIQIMKMTVK